MHKMKEPGEIGKTLRQLRGIRTRTGVAEELGISYSMLCKLESGERIPSDKLQQQIADYYGTPVECIFFADE